MQLAGYTPRLINPLGEKTLIKLAGITETAALIQEACSSFTAAVGRHRRLNLAIYSTASSVFVHECCM